MISKKNFIVPTLQRSSLYASLRETIIPAKMLECNVGRAVRALAPKARTARPTGEFPENGTALCITTSDPAWEGFHYFFVPFVDAVVSQ